MARTLRQLGFSDFRQVDDCIAGYDDDLITRKVHGTRRGQIERFELMLQAGMGEGYLSKHPWREFGWYAEICHDQLAKIHADGSPIQPNPPPQQPSDQPSLPP